MKYELKLSLLIRCFKPVYYKGFSVKDKRNIKSLLYGMKYPDYKALIYLLTTFLISWVNQKLLVVSDSSKGFFYILSNYQCFEPENFPMTK